MTPLAQQIAESRKTWVYVASKVKFAPMWQNLEERGAPINSTWPHLNPVTPADFAELWEYCLREASRCDALILYDPDGEHLKGALVEVGCALSHGKPVYVVGNPDALKTVMHHPLVIFADTLAEAFMKASGWGEGEVWAG